MWTMSSVDCRYSLTPVAERCDCNPQILGSGAKIFSGAPFTHWNWEENKIESKKN